MSEKMSIDKKKVITHEFRVSFPAMFTPKAFENQEPKYSIVMLFDKKVDLSKPSTNAKGQALGVSMKEAAANAATEKWGDRSKWPKNLRLPFRDGSERADTPGYEGMIFISSSSKNQPGLVDQKRQPILNERDFYAGCYARAQLIAFAYDKAGNKGVSFSLQNVQKLRDGDPFSGRKNAEDVFDAVEDGADDASNYSSDSNDMGF
jgi:hypothetical protein